MQRVIILRGPMGSGKTTIANHYRSFENGWAVLHVDQFKTIFDHFEKEARPVVHGAVNAALEYVLRSGFSVVIEGVLQDLGAVEQMISIAKRLRVKPEIFELSASLAILTERDETREEVREGMRKPLGVTAIDHIQKKLLSHPCPQANKIDTSYLSVMEVVEKIESLHT